jgi:hypothetical protein
MMRLRTAKSTDTVVRADVPAVVLPYKKAAAKPQPRRVAVAGRMAAAR